MQADMRFFQLTGLFYGLGVRPGELYDSSSEIPRDELIPLDELDGEEEKLKFFSMALGS